MKKINPLFNIQPPKVLSFVQGYTVCTTRLIAQEAAGGAEWNQTHSRKPLV